MKFFTDKTVINDYLLIKKGDYDKRRWKKGFKEYKEVFIDPGVYDLTKGSEYSWVHESTRRTIPQWLENLPENHFFSWDYPSDMNLKYTDLFLLKSWDNAIRYCGHSQYIVTVQYKFKDAWSFKHWFDKYNKLNIESGIMGLGNICRIHYLTDYIKKILKYAFENCLHQRIHVYGLGLRIIPYAVRLSRENDIELSIDSTKWTRNPEVSGLPSCRKHNRQEYFDNYMRIINERIHDSKYEKDNWGDGIYSYLEPKEEE